MALNTGVNMGGWFNKEVNTPEDFKGLRYRMPELGAEVLRRMGATVVTMPGSEIVGALKSGAIDASEWVGPWMDLISGSKAANDDYHPGFHEPGMTITLGTNKTLWDGLTAFEQALIEAAAQAEVTRSLGPVQRRERQVAEGSARRQTRRDPTVQRRADQGLWQAQQRGPCRRGREGSADPQGLRQLHGLLTGIMDLGELSKPDTVKPVALRWSSPG